MLFMLVCCRSKDENVEEVSLVVFDSVLAWDVNADSMIMKRDMYVPDSAINIDRIINGLNEKYPEVQLVFLKKSADTVYTKIPNGEHLGNEMGSAGASAWYADAVINLTSVPGVNYVSFSMDTFSHAGSTIIGRENYRDWKRQ
jgi:hypothetical protein